MRPLKGCLLEDGGFKGPLALNHELLDCYYFHAGLFFVIFLSTNHADLLRCEKLHKEAQAQINEELSRQKRVVDVLRLFCMTYEGVHITRMAAVTIFFSTLRFMFLAYQRMILTRVIILYIFSFGLWLDMLKFTYGRQLNKFLMVGRGLLG